MVSVTLFMTRTSPQFLIELFKLEVPEVGHAGSASITGRHVEAAEGPKLEEAAIVVAGGRGLGDAEKFELVDLADPGRPLDEFPFSGELIEAPAVDPQGRHHRRDLHDLADEPGQDRRYVIGRHRHRFPLENCLVGVE